MGLVRRAQAAAHLITMTCLPPACALCRAPVAVPRTLCHGCWPTVAFLGERGCGQCGHPLVDGAGGPDALCERCHVAGWPWREGRAALRYDGGGRALALGLKHRDRLDCLPLLGGWMIRAGGDLLARGDLLVPVPVHWTRLAKRRHNQAAGLAGAIARGIHRPGDHAPGALRRVRATPSQGRRDPGARRANVAGAFGPGGEAARLRGRRVVLIDDVLTTGATLAEAARACLDAGARAVDVLVLALVVRENAFYIHGQAEDEDHEDS